MSVKTLDLSREFSEVHSQLDQIAAVLNTSEA